jgi:hypothetical protein
MKHIRLLSERQDYHVQKRQQGIALVDATVTVIYPVALH